MSNTPPTPKLLDQVRDRIRVKHYSIRTEAQYVQWIRRFILFHGKRDPRNSYEYFTDTANQIRLVGFSLP